MRFLATDNGLESVTEAPEFRGTHPVRLVVRASKFGEPGSLTELAYEDLGAAEVDLNYMGEYFEDIALLEIEGARPEDLGFTQAY